MENFPSSATGAINLGAIAFHEGRLDDARALFAHAIQLDSENERGWLWFATVAAEPSEQRYCLKRALDINPESTGLQRLLRLPSGPATVPPDLQLVDEPPLPPDLAKAGKVALPILPRSTIERRQRARMKHSGGSGRDLPTAAATEAGAPGEAAGRRPRRWPRWLPLVIALAIAGVVTAVMLWQRQAGPLGNSYVIAFAGPLSGADAATGQEELRAIELAISDLNAAGGIGGRPVRVVSYDDQNDPALAAERAAQIVANVDVLLVIGHDRSDASLAAAPVYAAAGLAAISPASTADALTENDPWYFRSMFTNKQQGALIAAFAQHALLHDRASVVSTSNRYESSLATAFIDAFGQAGTNVAHWTIDLEDVEGSVARIVAELQATDSPGIVVLALQPNEAHQMVLALRRSGLDLPMIGGEAIGYEGFAALFVDEPEEAAQPGFFTNGLYVASPMIYDSLGGAALAFAQQYAAVNGVMPRWFGAKAYDAATLAFHALGATTASETDAADVAGQREQARDALAALDSVANSVPGLSGPLYFNATRSVPQSMSFGIFEVGRLLSTPVQYRLVSEPTDDLREDQAAGRIFEIDGQPFRQYRVAYVGVDVNEVSNLDVAEQTFNADFFLWFRYSGDESAEAVFFPNSTDPEGALPEPLDHTEVDGNHFTMYRIDGTFTDPLDFEDYPWDTHVLTLDMQNLTLSQDEIVYVPDQAILRLSQAERLRSGADVTQPFSRIANWVVNRVTFVQDSATVRSTTPDPHTGAPGYEEVSTFQTRISYARDVRAFLLKNMLPLALLALVTYISLYFSPANAITRISLSITSVLTASVMLQSIWSSLPDIGYIVAIEWFYYVYIGLSAVLVMVNITVDRWYKAKRFAAASQLDRLAQVVYPAVLLIVAAAFAIRYG